jgi:hypothetical protein
MTLVNQAACLLLVESYGSERQPLGPRQPGGCTGDCRKAAQRVRRVGTSESTLPQAARRVNRDLGKVEKDCRQAAPKEKQIGQSANQTPREGANQIDFAEDSFKLADAESPLQAK